MKFKFRANIVMSRELTVEADNLKEAMEKARDMMSEPFPSNELKPSKFYFDRINTTDL